MQHTKIDHEKKEMIIQQSINEVQQNLKDEVEQKVVFQKEAKDN